MEWETQWTMSTFTSNGFCQGVTSMAVMAHRQGRVRHSVASGRHTSADVAEDARPTPSGTAAVAGVSVGEERKVLGVGRKVSAGSHLHTHGVNYSPHTQFILLNGEWITMAAFAVRFLKGQRKKTRPAATTR